MKAYLDPQEITLLEQAALNLRDCLLIRMSFRLGARISEVLGIEIGNIDFVQSTVTIQHLKVRTNLSCPNCGASQSPFFILITQSEQLCDN